MSASTSRRVRQISEQEVAYLQLLITDLNPDSRKFALESIARLYRNGFRFRNPEKFIPNIHYLTSDSTDKVRRWAYNALALVGSRRDVSRIIPNISKERMSPDIFAALLAALSALADADQVRDILLKNDIPFEGMVLLAAAQQTSKFNEELVKAKVDLDNASISELRLATLLMGLKKAPENMFSERYRNADVIGELAKYDDELVGQYAVWAVFENDEMSLSNLKILPKDFDDYHKGIRKYAYRVMTKNKKTAQDNFDYVCHASTDDEVEAREGLALGLRGIFFDPVDDLVINWLRDEATDRVRNRLLEHMAVNSDRSPLYRKPLLQIYESLSDRSLDRARLEAAAVGTSLLADFKRIEFDKGMSDMFGYGSIEKEEPKDIPLEKPNPETATVLIVTALAKEAAAVRATFDRLHKVAKANDPTIYNLGSYRVDGEDRHVLIANSQAGTLRASVLGAHAIRSFPNIKHIIMVGIAGGCPNPSSPSEHVRLGDIVLSSHDGGIIEYDFVKKTDEGTEIRRSPDRPSAALAAAAAELSIGAIGGERPWEGELAAIIAKLQSYRRPHANTDLLYVNEVPIRHPKQSDREIGHPRIMTGVIGSADTLLKDAESRDFLRDKYGVRAVEMEASGLQVAGWASGRDIFVVRGICDYCDKHKNDVWQNYASAAAAAFAKSLILAMPAEWF